MIATEFGSKLLTGIIGKDFRFLNQYMLYKMCCDFL